MYKGMFSDGRRSTFGFPKFFFEPQTINYYYYWPQKSVFWETISVSENRTRTPRGPLVRYAFNLRIYRWRTFRFDRKSKTRLTIKNENGSVDEDGRRDGQVRRSCGLCDYTMRIGIRRVYCPGPEGTAGWHKLTRSRCIVYLPRHSSTPPPPN